MLNGQFHNDQDNKIIFFSLYLKVFMKKIDNLIKKKQTLFLSLFINKLKISKSENYDLEILIREFKYQISFLDKLIHKKYLVNKVEGFFKIKNLKKKKKSYICFKKPNSFLINSERLICSSKESKEKNQKNKKLNQSEKFINLNEKKSEKLKPKIKNNDKSLDNNIINFDALDIFLRKKKYLKYGGRLVFLKQKSKVNGIKLKNHVEKFENFLNLNF